MERILPYRSSKCLKEYPLKTGIFIFFFTRDDIELKREPITGLWGSGLSRSVINQKSLFAT